MRRDSMWQWPKFETSYKEDKMGYLLVVTGIISIIAIQVHDKLNVIINALNL